MRRLVCFLFVAVLAWPAAAQALPSTRVAPLQTSFLDIAHRGASGLAPEHTFAAYDLALTLGADVIEQDVAPTRDGHLVVLHDDTLDRTTDCTGRPEDKTLAELKRCDAGSWFNEAFPALARPEYAGQRIPTLDEVLTRYGDSVNYYIETKIYENGGELERQTIELLRKHGLEDRAAVDGQVILQSFLPQHVLRMQALAPRIPRVFLMTFPPEPVQLAFAASAADGIGPPVGSTDKALVDDAHGRGLIVHPYTSDDAEQLGRLQAAGADGAFTNRPDRFEGRRGLFADGPGAGVRGARVVSVSHLPAAVGDGPRSGAALAGTELLTGAVAPLAGQPVAGISGVVVRSRRRVLALPDDQWDTASRARDVQLRVLDLRLRGGRATVARTIVLRTTDGTPLTGATYDPEALARTPDGTLWVGEERGPSVLRFRPDGRMAGAPIRLPGLRAPAAGLGSLGNPLAARPLGQQPASTVLPSRGVQGLAVTHGGRRLIAAIAGPVVGEDPRTRVLVELSTRTRRPTGRRWTFRVGAPGHVVGDLVARDDRTLLALERDTRGGPDARVKVVRRIDLRRREPGGVAQRSAPVVDLLALAGGPPLAFPELDALALTDRGLLVVNDNDLPFSRVRRPGAIDGTELTELVPVSRCCAARRRSR